MTEVKKQDSLIHEVSVDEAVVEEIVRKHDTESRFRQLSGGQGLFITLWLLAMGLFQLYTASLVTWPVAFVRSVHLTFAIVAVFILFPATKRGDKRSTPWYDWVLALIAGAVIAYIAIYERDIARRGAAPHWYEIWLGITAILLVLEAARRTMGNILPLLAIIFLAYCYFGFFAPGMFQIRGHSLSRIIQHMYLTTEGLFGVALGVSATFVIIFIIFGAFMNECGGGRFFNELSLALAGNAVGGPAKVAVVGAGLLGSISGSSIATVATVGTFTIPLMKKVGYKPHYAAAITASASTGAQMTPPIMGAGAFIMSEFIGVPYLTIMLSAAIPAILFYACIFGTLHMRAMKDQLKGIPKEELPKARDVMMKDGHLLLPVFAIVATLLMRFTPLMAGFAGIVSMFLVSQLRAHTRMGPTKVLNAIVNGCRTALGVAMACAVVGFIVGTTTLTGVGQVISSAIVGIAGGSLIMTLLMTFVACLILGLGLPTTAKYIVASTVLAPALISQGVMPLAAHLFIFYFALMADITPPVCLASFTAAGIAGSEPQLTAVTATRVTLCSYFIPFIFVFDPTLILNGMQGGVDPLHLTLLVGSILLAIIAMAGCLEGWLKRDLRWWERIPMGIMALVAIHPDFTWSVVGSVAIIAAYIFFKVTAKQTPQAIA